MRKLIGIVWALGALGVPIWLIVSDVPGRFWVAYVFALLLWSIVCGMLTPERKPERPAHHQTVDIMTGEPW